MQNTFHQARILSASFIRGLGKVINVPSMEKASAVEMPLPICLDLVNWYVIDPISEKKINNLEEAIMHDIDGEQTSYTGQYFYFSLKVHIIF